MNAHVDALQIGEGANQLLALHASGSGARSLSAFARALGEDVTVTIANLHGYGGSRCDVEEITSLEQHFEVALAALTSLGEAPVHLFGHSMGGVVALELASRYPEKIASLHLAEPVTFGVLHRSEDADVIAQDRASIAAFAQGASDGLSTFIEYWNGSPWQALPERARSELGALREQIAREALEVSANNASTDPYRTLQCPVQLLAGARTNPVAKRICRRLSQQFPGWDVAEVPDAGHMLPMEQPDRVAALVANYLR